MKKSFSLAILIFLTAIGFSTVPRTAHAEPVMNCTNGCTIVTCNATTCSITYCDASGCSYVTSYPKPVLKTPTKKLAPMNVRSVEYVKVCPDNSKCSLYRVATEETLNLGSFDNIDDIVNKINTVTK